MTKRLLLILVVAVGGGGWVGWDRTHTAGVRNGEAFGAGGAYATIGMSHIRKGDDVFYIAPAPNNCSDDQLTLRTVGAEKSSPGLDYVDAKVYKRADFPAGVPLTGGGQENSVGAELASRTSQPVAGYKLDAGQLMDDVIYLHFRVTTDQRPLESSGVAIGYQQDGRTFTQVLPAVFRLENAPAGAK
ncbi:hypothetical protein [Kribbella qitaiheensis]|uniref:hypothetical protein n=1 Tax=Kribbella qitaiheensis TaxID=1544730 RepID=UPI001FE76B30|nr:hypothetical protein [Kribbella qitaiheensis]